MENFRPMRGGYLARADETERRFMRGLATDVAYMLGHPIDEYVEQSERVSDDPLAAYEAELSGISADDGEVSREWESKGPIDDAFYRLLPDMSELPEEAAALRMMTEDSLAAVKSEHLRVFWRSLNAVGDDVWVDNEDVPAWLAGANSVRIVVAARLDIHDEESGDAVYRHAEEITGADGRGKGREIDDPDDLLAVLYTMIAWWQESLLVAVRNKSLRG